MSEAAVMPLERMIHKANQTALNFAPYPHETAVANIADHFKKFWTPPMRAQLVEHVANGGEGLHELAVEAASSL